MKKILFGFLFMFAAVFGANATPQHCIIAGDSIQTFVYEPQGVVADQSKLTASLLPTLANIAITNISATGQRMASSGYPGYGLVSNQNILFYTAGSTTPTCIIIALGTNDWTSTPGTAIGFIQAYRQVVRYSKALGMQVVCATPTLRNNEGTLLAHPDGSFTIAQYRDWISSICFEENAKVFDAMQIGLVPSDFADGLHMNAFGHIKYTNALLSQLLAWGIIQ